MIQIDMDMPNECIECTLANRDFLGFTGSCSAVADSPFIEFDKHKRMDWCPLKEEKKETFSVLIRKSSDWNYEEVREFHSLEECLETLLKELYWDNGEFVVESGKTNWYINKMDHKDERIAACKWYVEIYDGYRE